MRAARRCASKRTFVPVSSAVLACAVAGQASAAPPPITWGSATNISGDSDVSTAGTLVYAYNIGGAGVSSATVNGVTFASYAFPAFNTGTQTVSVGSVTFTESPGFLWGSNSLSSGTGSFAALSSPYRSLLGTGGGASIPDTITVTLGGLTGGRDYQLQVWSSFIGGPTTAVPGGGYVESTTFGQSGSTVTLDANVGNATGGLGQYALGTFSVTGTGTGFSRTFQMSATSFYSPLINALQLRDVTIPGPGGVAVAAIAGTVLSCGRRRRR